MSPSAPNHSPWRRTADEEPGPVARALNAHAEEIAEIARNTSEEEIAEILKNPPPIPGIEKYQTPPNPRSLYMPVD